MMVIEIGYEYFTGNLKHVWADPKLHFSYFGFEWLPAWPPELMYAHFAVTGVFALLLALGLWYRFSAVLFFLGYAYIFLIEQAAFQNHLYFFCLIGFLLIFVPLNRSMSLDVHLKRVAPADTIDTWVLWLIRFQVGIVYFFGGVAKLNLDWLHGEPVRMWIARRSDYAIIGPFVEEEWLVYFFTYGGLLFDLFIVPLLLWRRTRPYAFGAVLFFNLTNAFLFKIGPFPYVMLLGTLIFLEPEWPRTVIRRFIQAAQIRNSSRAHKPTVDKKYSLKKTLVTWGLLFYVVIHLLLPMRAYLYPGDPSWTDEGHFFSWRMMLRDKRVTDATIVVHNRKTGENLRVNPDQHMEPWQSRIMFRNPEMLRQFAVYLSKDAEREGIEGTEVYARVLVSLNGKSPELLVDASTNLAAQPRTISAAEWIGPGPGN